MAHIATTADVSETVLPDGPGDAAQNGILPVSMRMTDGARHDAEAADDAASEHEDEDDDGAGNPARVLLSDGRIVILRQTTGLDEESVESKLTRWGYTLESFDDATTLSRALAIFGIELLDGEPFSRPTKDVELDIFWMRTKVRDLIKLQGAYDKINGEGAKVPVLPAGRVLLSNECLLSNGHIVRVREETGHDERRRIKLLDELGYACRPMTPRMASRNRAGALLSIEALDGEPKGMPQTRTHLQKYLAWPACDTARITTLHARVNGMIPPGDTDGDGGGDGDAFRG